MLGKVFMLSALVAGLSASGALASQSAGAAREANQAAGSQSEGILLAQAGDVEIFYDGNGNRVIIDAYTGEIIAVQPPRRVRPMNRPALRRALRAQELDREERYYLDDPEDMERLRRRKLGDYRLLPPPVDEYDYPDAAREPSIDEFPPAPRRRTLPELREQPPRVVDREPVEREPLDEPAGPSAPGETIVVDPVAPPPMNFTAREDVAGIQVLMDRTGASPGVIDGKFGSNVDKAFDAYRETTGTSLRSTDSAGIKAALAATGGDPFTTYTITAADAAGPFVASVPADYSKKAQLENLSYTSVLEMLAEKFHMDEGYLKALNPEANFSRPGTIIRVANVGAPVTKKVQRIVADKGRKQVRAYDEEGELVAAYPATIGSTETPSPTGTHAVSRVAFNPNYTYNPKVNFKQGQNDKILTIPPGPNGPVGSIWIALDKPTYGIHGTPDPSKIGKTESHGCVRLTNWDAQELAKLVSVGVMVEFVE
ncbi:L,D-transpeptidase [Allomesorhizobium camelthorni]|uniref:L,D-transpeptidase family protein n=1 Tax=Allomesorhizobium camelthorni TaxID=475069 RepID=A0A6G4W9V0_9HYPH|nr:L,D-transpeptidase [Mesorhizobium camelthorni]NGO51552.1 L,D-transpeptidase family protein [Mesorhizobium camelthorni]